MGQKYICIYHGQGDYVSDCNAFGWNLSEQEVDFITWIEKIGMENAYKTYFPSLGARKHFLDTIREKISIEKTEPLYNCIYDYPQIDVVDYENKDFIHILSIGQMTSLKGMDKMPLFIERIYKCVRKKIKWTVVADGMLKNDVAKMIFMISELNGGKDYIDYEIIDNHITHQEIYSLMAKSDLYIMLHRISIFDFSTLEAMYMKKAIILSDVEGNDEFNKEDNILMVNESLTDYKIKDFIENRKMFGNKNRDVYDRYFSKECFRNRYLQCIRSMEKENGL